MAVTELHVTIVDAALARERHAWGDGADGWQPPALAWTGRLTALGVPFRVRADVPARPTGLVVVPDPEADDVGGPAALTGAPPDTAEETLQLLAQHLGAVVVPDQRGVLVLRLDDPGAAVKRHLSGWAHDAADARTWAALWSAVEGFGRVSVFCCPGYVSADGTVVDSRGVLAEEWAAIDDGVARGLAELECHGYTHMHPDVSAWVAAPDRFDNVAWYRELWPPNVAVEPSVQAQSGRLALWQAATGRPGTALVAPGEAWGLNTIAAARRQGFRVFNSWAVCFLQGPMPVWTLGVGSPYLDEPGPDWFSDGLPQVGYWHDRDMVVNGPGWVADRLAAWRDCGARRAWSFADLARAHVGIDAALVDGDVVVRSAPDVPLRVVQP